MLRNAPRRRSCRSFVRNQGWWDTVVNNYSDERFKYTFRMSRNTFNYILENIRGGLQKQIVTDLTICPEMSLSICLYKLTRGDYYYTIGKMADTAQSTICRIAIKVSELITEMIKQYYNFKNFYSIILLTLTDARYLFTWVSVRAPGSTHDSSYFQSTDLLNRVEAGLVILD